MKQGHTRFAEIDHVNLDAELGRQVAGKREKVHAGCFDSEVYVGVRTCTPGGAGSEEQRKPNAGQLRQYLSDGRGRIRSLSAHCDTRLSCAPRLVHAKRDVNTRVPGMPQNVVENATLLGPTRTDACGAVASFSLSLVEGLESVR
jgi:hypothetical protein